MKNLFLILVIILFSCEELEEQTTPLSGIFYVFEGWNEFMNKDYERAKELFSATLLADQNSETNYYDYAYAGLGWTAIYKANINPGVENRTLRENLRSEAINHFNSAELGIQIRLDSSNMNQLDSLLYANIIAGKIFNTSYLSIDKAMEFYSDGSDDLVWLDALNYSQLVISESDILLEVFSDYNFEYDESINVEDIRIVRAQSFIRLGDFASAVNEIEFINSLDCNLSQISIIECLHSSNLNP